MSLITISSPSLSVTVDSHGASLTSVIKNGSEYLWQPDSRYWDSQDLNLFPYIGRLKENCYLYRGEKYSMTIHGFSRSSNFDVTSVSDSSVSFSLVSSEETMKNYPFPFIFTVEYSISGSVLTKTCTVLNTGEGEMYFALGSHPGFNVPINSEGSFDDWYLEFTEESEPARIGFNQTDYLLSGDDRKYQLEEGRIIRLSHRLFDEDAIVLHGMPKQVTLKSDLSGKAVRARYEDMDFVGFWHMPHTDAPYVCIEPWKALPSHSAYIEDISKQEYLVHLESGKEYSNTVSFEII